MSLTGLPKKLEEAFLRQIKEEEMRARRALRILEHLQRQVSQLQQQQQQQQQQDEEEGVGQNNNCRILNLLSSSQDSFHNYDSLSAFFDDDDDYSDEKEDDEGNNNNTPQKNVTQYEEDNLVYLMKQTLLEDPINISDHQDEEFDPVNPISESQVIKNLNSSLSNHQRIMDHKHKFLRRENESDISNDIELTKVETEMTMPTKDVLMSSKRKIQNLEALLKEMEESSSNSTEVNSLLEEMSGWRLAIDNALLSMETAKKSVVVVDDKVWKTALRFFTPCEAMHFLFSSSSSSSPQKIAKNTVPKVSSST